MFRIKLDKEKSYFVRINSKKHVQKIIEKYGMKPFSLSQDEPESGFLFIKDGECESYWDSSASCSVYWIKLEDTDLLNLDVTKGCWKIINSRKILSELYLKGFRWKNNGGVSYIHEKYLFITDSIVTFSSLSEIFDTHTNIEIEYISEEPRSELKIPDCYIEVDPESSKEIQRILFELGITWNNGEIKILLTDIEHLVILNNKIYCANYHDSKFLKYTSGEFLKLLEELMGMPDSKISMEKCFKMPNTSMDEVVSSMGGFDIDLNTRR